MSESTDRPLAVAICQMAPVFLDRRATLARVLAEVRAAASEGAGLIALGEALVPGYPVWLSRTDGASFESEEQKRLFALYADQAVCLERGDLEELQGVVRELGVHLWIGVIERPRQRSGHSLYCSLVSIDSEGAIRNVHRKLMPTFEERLVWSTGDGAGLRTRSVGAFTVGGLNCWENWMPTARAALQGDGEDLHIATWPGGGHNTEPTTRFLAKEGRSFVLAASGVLRAADVPGDVPLRSTFVPDEDEWLLNGGSAIAAPDGSWCVEPCLRQVTRLHYELDPRRVREERQNFDPAGHYSRPDVLELRVDRRRQSTVRWIDE